MGPVFERMTESARPDYCGSHSEEDSRRFSFKRKKYHTNQADAKKRILLQILPAKEFPEFHAVHILVIGG